MHVLITGAGQIGTQLANDLAAGGHSITFLRRSDREVSGTTVVAGDAGDRDTVRRAASSADAIFHCIHAGYSAAEWRAALPHRELAVMDVAAERDIPVVFPESVYAFGHGARDLSEDAPLAPVSPLGEVRAELLTARAAHPARTASLVASDFVGPTADPKSSVVLAMALTPAGRGRTAWVLGDPAASHAVTYLPDLTRGMIAALPLATSGGRVLLAPTGPALSQRQMAHDAATAAGQRARRVLAIPFGLFAIGGFFSATLASVYRQRYLWSAPSALRPGTLMTELGIAVTPWAEIVDEWASSLRTRYD